MIAGCWRTFAIAAGLLTGPFVACDEQPVPGEPVAVLLTHEIQPSAPSAEGLAYIKAVAKVHRDADVSVGLKRVRALQKGLALPVPAGLPEAEILRLGLATQLAEIYLQREGGAAMARDLLGPMLDSDRSLPLDRASARALVTLGDAALAAKNDALAAGSYARAVRLMSMLREALET